MCPRYGHDVARDFSARGGHRCHFHALTSVGARVGRPSRADRPTRAWVQRFFLALILLVFFVTNFAFLYPAFFTVTRTEMRLPRSFFFSL